MADGTAAGRMHRRATGGRTATPAPIGPAGAIRALAFSAQRVYKRVRVNLEPSEAEMDIWMVLSSVCLRPWTAPGFQA